MQNNSLVLAFHGSGAHSVAMATRRAQAPRRPIREDAGLLAAGHVTRLDADWLGDGGATLR